MILSINDIIQTWRPCQAQAERKPKVRQFSKFPSEDVQVEHVYAAAGLFSLTYFLSSLGGYLVGLDSCVEQAPRQVSLGTSKEVSPLKSKTDKLN